MKLIRKTEISDKFENDQCRIKAAKAPVLGSRYEVWFTRGGQAFHAKGKFPEVEGLMIKEEAQPAFYHSLVRASRRIGDEKSLEMDLSLAKKRCICSLSMWSQDMETVSAITGLSLEDSRRMTFGLYHAGYVTLVQKGRKTVMALSAKGWRALEETCDGALRTEVLNRTIEIYSARELETLRSGSRLHV